MKKLWRTVSRKFRKPRTRIPPQYAGRVAEVERIMRRMVKERKRSPKYWSLDDFEVGETLGEGGFGEVWLAREVETDFVVAIKVLQIPGQVGEEATHDQICAFRRSVIKEIDTQAHLKHPHILQLYNYFSDGMSIYVVLEIAPNGELPNDGTRLDPHDVARWISQVAQALQYCHDMNVVHRDIKPENLLLDINNNIKLADFGLAFHSPSQTPGEDYAGTMVYISPEMATGKPYWSKVDNWALGILLYELTFGEVPFDPRRDIIEKLMEKNVHPREIARRLRKFQKAIAAETFKVIAHNEIPWPEGCESATEDVILAMDLIKKLLIKNPEERISLKNALQHPFILTYGCPH